MPVQQYHDEEDINTRLRNLNQRPGRMIQLASLLSCQAAIPIQYNTEFSITTTESGLLFFIANNPGVTNTTLASQFGRTKGAISQIVKRLEANGYIAREQNPNDAKSYNLYTTVLGNKLVHTINEYDMNNENSMLQKLLHNCSVADIQTFFRMVDLYIALLIPQAKAGKAPPQEEAE
jgi:DNA-binding MarR family transcriptional regulator